MVEDGKKSIVDEYVGAKLVDQVNMEIDSIRSSISAEEFFTKYIATRKPARFIDVMTDDAYPVLSSKTNHVDWTNDYLRKNAGDERLKVEVRKTNTERFGMGNEINMSFGEFLDAIENENENYYLTTQNLVYDAEDRPSIVSPPINKLMTDIPWTPRLFGNLVTQNINLWFGSSKIPTTSGLHHDFHDNLYILLRGEKRISLYSPDEYSRLYLKGEVVKVHRNGRINYKGQSTLADGSAPSALQALKAAEALEKAALRLIHAEQQGEEDVSDIEEEIDDALEAALDAEINDQEIDEDYDDNSDEEDYDKEEDCENDEDSNHDSGFSSNSNNNSNEKASKRRRTETSNQSASDFDEGKELPGFMKEILKPGTKSKRKNEQPDNFSQVDTSLSLEEIAQLYPLFSEAASRRIDVELKAGEMLYIPAGWFHEVRSLSQISPSTESGGHMALNYWAHPPDTTDFHAPYCSDFWRQDWTARKLSGQEIDSS